MPDLAQYVMTYISAPVVDKTGLSGTYEYQFPLPLFRSGQRGGATGAPPSPQDMVAEFSNTLEEHLGLKLEARRSVSVETLVIDHVEKPSAN
jgi:uncharacterized protein (TIGR03435 family)